MLLRVMKKLEQVACKAVITTVERVSRFRRVESEVVRLHRENVAIKTQLGALQSYLRELDGDAREHARPLLSLIARATQFAAYEAIARLTDWDELS